MECIWYYCFIGVSANCVISPDKLWLCFIHCPHLMLALYMAGKLCYGALHNWKFSSFKCCSGEFVHTESWSNIWNRSFIVVFGQVCQILANAFTELQWLLHPINYTKELNFFLWTFELFYYGHLKENVTFRQECDF